MGFGKFLVGHSLILVKFFAKLINKKMVVTRLVANILKYTGLEYSGA